MVAFLNHSFSFLRDINESLAGQGEQDRLAIQLFSDYSAGTTGVVSQTIRYRPDAGAVSAQA